MMSNLRLSLLAILGGLSLWAMPAATLSMAQSDIPVIPANPTENPLSVPLERDPAASAPSAPEDSELAPSAPTPSTPSRSVSEPLVQPAAAGETTNYSDALMSFDFPADWKVDISDQGVMIANVTTDEAALVATQIAQVAVSPGAVVNTNIDSFIAEGAAVGQYRTVTIDDQDALVIWLSERPGVLSNAIATFIGYGNQTVLLFTRYAPENAAVEDDILRLHTSYRNLANIPAVESDVAPE